MGREILLTETSLWRKRLTLGSRRRAIEPASISFLTLVVTYLASLIKSILPRPTGGVLVGIAVSMTTLVLASIERLSWRATTAQVKLLRKIGRAHPLTRALRQLL